MKKIFYALLISAFSLVLISCNKKIDNIVFSKVFTAQRMANNVIELYNNSEKDIDLKNYELKFYNDGSEEVTNSISLEGTIKAFNYYVVIGPNFDKEEFPGVDEKSDLVHDKTLPFNGDDAIVLSKGKKVVDVFGFLDTKAIAVKFSENTAMFRLGQKEDYEPSNTFEKFNFIQYLPDAFDYIKNDDHKIKTLEDLYKGPGLHDFYKERPYVIDGMGTGGAPIATVTHIADGDTATFDFAEKPSPSSHRYYYIDTAETAGPNTNDEPWGAIGTKYNKEFILNNPENKEIRVQSIPNSAIIDTYQRNLGLIWTNDKLSQFLIVQEGLSTVDDGFTNIDLELYWHDVPYLTFLLFAQERAKNNGWGLHGYPTDLEGEKSPDWDYTNNKRAPLTSYQDWKPHINIIW